MAQDARISSRIDLKLKTKGDAILAELGVKPSQAITMFYTQIVRQQGIPLELKIPNKETIDGINENLTHAPRFTSVEALMSDLNSNDIE